MKQNRITDVLLPWHELLHKACRELGWSPHTFWQATPKELEMALNPPGHQDPHSLSRSALDDLLRQFPDQQEPHHHD
ncbi:phage tail assembly chaperone [Pseudovibrio sp. SCP19]|uniref:phage tail assembly chaperone n=1 Tax=Pseudovibrio sp. SCP19 TaxID=3141374 RepID=UPI00333C08F6